MNLSGKLHHIWSYQEICNQRCQIGQQECVGVRVSLYLDWNMKLPIPTIPSLWDVSSYNSQVDNDKGCPDLYLKEWYLLVAIHL